MKSQNNKDGPLKGLVVADFSQLAQGPWATQMLGDMGADIIKIEPKKGDWMRHYSYGNLYPKGESISFVSFNRNKRSIAVDLKDDEGSKIVRNIIAKSDILIENFLIFNLNVKVKRLRKSKNKITQCHSFEF